MPQDTKKGKGKAKTGLSETVRKFITMFNPGAVAIERKVTPEIKKATKKAKSRK
jgi:hypothetical protein